MIRKDIQALRALAVTLVVVFHFWPNLIGGGFVGVDVFFAISGFLITGHLLRDVAAERFSVTDFWARRIRRLIPASFLVLAVTAITVQVFAAATDRVIWFGEITASAGYFENWQLANSAVDYLALGNSPSPVQHFWSLSAEEQFYFVWPILIALGVWAAKRIGRSNRGVLFTGLVALTVASLAYSIYYTHKDAVMAYFVTPTRVWEFGVGALVAFAPRASVSPRLARFGFAIAFISIVAAALQIKPTDAFPGALAAWPVVATAAAIWLWPEGGWLERVLGIRVIQKLGDISYSVYLWHWPILILVPVVFGIAGEVQVGWQLVEIAATLGLAALTRKQVELRFIERKSGRAKTFVSMAVTAALLIGSTSLAIVPAQAEIDAGLKLAASIGSTPPDCIGAQAIKADGRTCKNQAYSGEVIPAVTLAADDSMTKAFPQCKSGTRNSSEPLVCHIGDTNSKIKVALVGDSHANQYAAALDLIGKAQHWSIDVVAKGGCPLSYTQRVQDATLTASCTKWVTNVVRYLDQQDYKLIVTSMKSGVEWVGNAVAGIAQVFADISNTRIPVVYIKDNPRPTAEVTQCLIATQARQPQDCAVSENQAIENDPAVSAVSKLADPLITVADFDKVFCQNGKCLPVIGNVVVYRDDNHLTNTFVKTLAPRLGSILTAAITPQG